MTDNTQFKKEAGELLDRLIDFRRKYIKRYIKEMSPAADFEGLLRSMLTIARTDEENQEQYKKDGQI